MIIPPLPPPLSSFVQTHPRHVEQNWVGSVVIDDTMHNYGGDCTYNLTNKQCNANSSNGGINEIKIHVVRY